MKTTIEMPDDLFRTAKSVAAIRGQTLKQLITTAIERELTANQTIGSTELSTEDYLRRLDALAQDNATARKTGKTAEESVVLSSTTWNRCRAVGTRTRSKRSVPETRYTMKARRWGESLLCDPYYNPNLSLDDVNFTLAFPPRAQKPWLKRLQTQSGLSHDNIHVAGSWYASMLASRSLR